MAKRVKKTVDEGVVLERLKVEYVACGELKPNTYNPNRQADHDFELLCKSMMEDGFTQPIVAIAGSNEIVDGEHRWRAAMKIGMTRVPVVLVEMTPEQARIATLRHNRARGSEDIELAAEVMRDLAKLGALDWAQESLMLDDVEMARLLDDVPLPEEKVGDADWLPTVEAPQTLEELEAKRDAEKAMIKRKMDEDHASAVKEADVYRISLVFAGDEGLLVKACLGTHAASELLSMCQYAHDQKAAQTA